MRRIEGLVASAEQSNEGRIPVDDVDALLSPAECRRYSQQSSFEGAVDGSETERVFIFKPDTSWGRRI